MTNQYSYAEDFSASARRPAQKQAEPNISSAAKVYMLSRREKENAASGYRNGEYKGNKYMTSEDFVTYFRNSRGKVSYAAGTRKKTTEENAGEILRSRDTSVKSNSSAVPNVSGGVRLNKSADNDDGDVKIYRPAKSKSRSARDNDATNVFKRIDGEKLRKLKTVANDWLPEEKIIDVKVKRSPGRIAKMAVAVAGIAVSLMMIVGGSVLVSDAARETKELENELSALELERAELSFELDMKNDVNVIRDRAVNDLGMIRKEYVDAKYLDVSGSDIIQAHEGEDDKDVGLSAILSAFGIG